MSSDNASRPRARQACEPCRRKKTKCPGERPMCSVCTRLRQPCAYAAHLEEFRVQKTGNTEYSMHPFIQTLAGRVERIEDVLSILRETQTGASTSTLTPGIHNESVDATQSVPNSPYTPSSTRSPHFHLPDRTIPPRATVEALVDLYWVRFDTFGFCVFDTDTLAPRLNQGSTVLLWAFLALTVQFSDDTFFSGVRNDAKDYFVQLAREGVFRTLYNNRGSLETLQTLCLLCYGEILDGKTASALMTVGVAVRYAMCTNLFSSRSGEVSRCLWTLYLLDRAYGSSFKASYAFQDDMEMPEMPVKMARPQTPNILESETETVLSDNPEEGVTSSAFKLLTSWSTVFTYLKKVKFGMLEDAWRPGSVYQRIASELLEIEYVFPQKHRLQFLQFDQRSAEDMMNDRQYWKSWIASQLLYHATRAVHNHPLVHFTQKNPRPPYPPSFLQQIADQAILHSQWVSKLVEMCNDKEFAMHDPLAAYLISVTATVHFFLCFAKDEALATKSAENFHICRQHVEAASHVWKHLKVMTRMLSELGQIIVNHRDTGTSSPPKIKEALIWALLDCAASTNITNTQLTSDEVVEVNIRTQYLSPLDPNILPSGQGSTPGNFAPDSAYPWLSDSLMSDMLEIPQIPGFAMPDTFWTDG